MITSRTNRRLTYRPPRRVVTSIRMLPDDRDLIFRAARREQIAMTRFIERACRERATRVLGMAQVDGVQ